MKRIILSSIVILTVGIIGFGQKNVGVKGGSSQSANGNASATAGRNSADLALAEGTRIDGELQKTLDVRNAKPGDQVLLKTTRDIKQNGHTVIQKGSTLFGRVTDVAQRSKQNGESRLGILFDRVQGHGLDMPISASIVSITNAAAHATAMDMGDADIMTTSSSSGSYSSGGRSSGGGLLSGVGNTVGGVTNTVGSTTGSVVNTTRQTVGGVANTTGRTVGGVTNGVASGVSGISILNSGSTSASAGNGSVLASSNQNIRLEKGSMIGLELNSSSSASVSRSH